STPPTFILSQDQTLHNDVDLKLETSRSGDGINPHLERLRKKTGRIKPAAREPFSSSAPRLLPVLCRPSRRCSGLRTTKTVAPRNGGSHAGFPQGFLTTRRMLPHPSRSCLLSRFLADECNQPNCQRAQTRRYYSYAAASPLVHRVSPIPSAGASCLLASHPGRRDQAPMTGGKLIVSTLDPPVKSPKPLFTKKNGFPRNLGTTSVHPEVQETWARKGSGLSKRRRPLHRSRRDRETGLRRRLLSARNRD